MFAVIQTGGKQYTVREKDILKIEKLDGKAGDKINFDEVLTLGGDKPKTGAPLIKGASVSAEILEQGKADKVLIFKKRRRHNYRRKRGHRQHLTTVRITGIKASGGKSEE